MCVCVRYGGIMERSELLSGDGKGYSLKLTRPW